MASQPLAPESRVGIDIAHSAQLLPFSSLFGDGHNLSLPPNRPIAEQIPLERFHKAPQVCRLAQGFPVKLACQSGQGGQIARPGGFRLRFLWQGGVQPAAVHNVHQPKRAKRAAEGFHIADEKRLGQLWGG